MAQNLELHMALKKRGVPTEFFVYPGQPHGLQEPRYQLVKMMGEMTWFEHWIRGKPWFTWDELLATADRMAGKDAVSRPQSAVTAH
jgi:acetyl esterase/lipase